MNSERNIIMKLKESKQLSEDKTYKVSCELIYPDDTHETIHDLKIVAPSRDKVTTPAIVKELKKSHSRRFRVVDIRIKESQNLGEGEDCEGEELEEAWFDTIHGHYACSWGNYYKDGQPITREEYIKARDESTIEYERGEE
jgi:hypothetical protein